MSNRQSIEKETFIEFVRRGHFYEAYNMIKYEDKDDIKLFFDGLFKMSYHESNITGHAFCYYVFSVTEDSQWLSKCIKLLAMANSPVEGAYALALHYAREMYDYAREMHDRFHIRQALDWMLFLYSLPEGLLSDDEAFDIAQKMLAVNSDHEESKKIIEDIQKKKKKKDRDSG